MTVARALLVRALPTSDKSSFSLVGLAQVFQLPLRDFETILIQVRSEIQVRLNVFCNYAIVNIL
jgi:hypothetical protein